MASPSPLPPGFVVKKGSTLKRRDEAAFVQTVRQYHGQLLRLAMVYARSRAVAEEIVQDTWPGSRGYERATS